MTSIDELLLDIPEPPAEPELLSAADALFSVPGSSQGTTQWRAERMQLVNWGGFDGVTAIDFHPGSTLLSGASGTGKSTVLDAYTALLMRSDVPFNGASNDAAGRSRGVGQRSLVSYLRGQTDTMADGEGDERAQVLRGENGPTWGAVAITYVNDHGTAFTAARVYFVPASARLGGDIQQRMITFDGRLSLRDLEPFAAEQFIPAKLRAHAPGLLTHDSYQAFAARLFTRLGIGANGDGDKALQLLARVQAGHQFRTVDALYKEMVLELPATFAAADQALAHFDSLAETYYRMQDEYRKVQLLEPITDAWDRLTTARSTIASVDAFGVSAPGLSPLTLWALRREADLTEAATTATHTEFIEADGRARRQEGEHTALIVDLEAVRAEHTEAGGGSLHSLAAQINEAEGQTAQRQFAMDDLRGRLRAVINETVDLTDPEVFAELGAEGRAFTHKYVSLRAGVAERAEAVRLEEWTLNSTIGDLDTQLRAMKGRTSRVDIRLLRMREQVIAATGLTEADLPFVAELVDVPAQHQAWRTAIETVLGGAATKMAVPADAFARFSRQIDSLKLTGRLRFEAATLGLPDAPPAPRDTVVGKLVFKDSPFRGWVTRYLAQSNATCVLTADELAGPGVRVSAAGQTRRGTSGSHGRSDERNILGFSNEDLVAGLTAQRDALRDELEPINAEAARLRSELTALEDRYGAYLVLSGAQFAQVDVNAPRSRAAELTLAREKILAGSDRLAKLQERMDALDSQVTTAHTVAVLSRKAAQDLHESWESLVARKDALTEGITDIENNQRVILTDEQASALDGHFRDACGEDDPEDLLRWPTNQGLLRKRLLSAQERARADEARSQSDLERSFRYYLEAFPDPNLDATLGSYADFARILDEVRSVGLHERRAQWRERVMDWSGQDLVPLAQAMQTAIDDIDDRMGPVNDILRRLPFGATQDRLRIRMRRLTRDQVVAFRKQLKRLSSGATLTLDDAQMQARFRELEAFMAKVRGPRDSRFDSKLSARDDLLDVRRHVEIRAERFATDGRVLSNYTSLGSKSGGETQELIAFIVGAALRFRLGDEDRARPRFAPVFLDEGFIKADAEFASRAVQAWTGLGFQLIIGAPLDKVAALEPHMDTFLLVTKNQRTKFSRVRAISDAERSDARRQGAHT